MVLAGNLFRNVRLRAFLKGRGRPRAEKGTLSGERAMDGGEAAKGLHR